MPSPPSRPRICRLQFSLRWLLLLMFGVGIALVIYRWPWEEEHDPPGPERTVTRYHRGWNGKPVKHGWEVEYGEPFTTKRWFDEGDLRLTQNFEGDKLFAESAYRNGKLNGSHFGIGSESSARGNYRNDKQHGPWRYEFADTICDELWQNGQRHGLRTWKTKSGRVLQTAHYEDDRLVEWNGKPVAEELQRWLNGNVPDVKMRELMQMPVTDTDYPQGLTLHYCEVLHFMGDPTEHLVVQWDEIRPNTEFSWNGRPVGENIVEHALENSRTLAFRYGLINVVPISAAELDWQDRTGVYDVHFAADSPQAKEWMSDAVAHPFREGYPAEILRILFHPETKRLIEIDTTAIDDLESPYTGPEGSTLPNVPRPLRDLIGQHLDRFGYYVEQRENTLIFKPYADRRGKQTPR